MITNVLDYLDATAKRLPDKTGFADDREEMTFAQFRTTARRLATRIPPTVRRQPVVVYMTKSIRELCAFAAVAYSGNFYVPIDPSMPQERADTVLSVLQPSIVVIDDEKYIPFWQTYPEMQLVHWDAAQTTEADEDRLAAVRAGHCDTDPLYVLFTSGSTGVPKGVVISHKSVIDYAEWLAGTFGFNEHDVFGNQAPFYFDNSILDIYTAFKTGAKLYILPETLFIFPVKLLQRLHDEKITTIFWVPSALVAVANSGTLEGTALPALRRVLFCGEVMPNKQLNIWRRSLPAALYANLYGPTEITDVCTCYIVDREFADSEPLPIGRACSNTAILLLNEKNEPCAPAEQGEICVRGTSLALGYYGAPDKTAEVFVQNPLNTKWHERIYRTGDIGMYNDRGELLCLGRKDFQIKHMGHRIELGEIETAASGLAGVRHCCAVYDDVRKKIWLFCVADGQTDKSIYAGLKSKLPRYMLPAVICMKDRLELNANGKINRKLLKQEMEATQ